MPSTETLSTTIARLRTGLPPAADAGLFGANLDPNECQLIVVPVPWDATVSYGEGTHLGPSAILKASHQLDLEDACFGPIYERGICMLPEPAEWQALNKTARSAACQVIANTARASDLDAVNAASLRLNTWVEKLASMHLQAGRRVAVVGGDHSSPFGLIKALSQHRRTPFGILHIDAHHDLRQAYEGFEHSHASIMHNVLEHIPVVSKLVQIGIRDYSQEESLYAQSQGTRAQVFYARDVFRQRATGTTWGQITARILEHLPTDVYVSFDIDGLDAHYCPSTGTPVPGGLSFDEACYLIEELAVSGRNIIGFDLCEVAPDRSGSEWDANVGARVLYKLCGAVLAK